MYNSDRICIDLYVIIGYEGFDDINIQLQTVINDRITVYNTLKKPHANYHLNKIYVFIKCRDI